ncbi:MAG TPA: hypothetical protein HPP66_01535 [Planctomycetes bacterium]|nr:hypothetical protein [Planctomycetota bacterium]
MAGHTVTPDVSEESQNRFDLSMPVQYLKGVGPARARAFAQLGVHTVADLLEYYPRDWNFEPELVKINQMQPDRTAAVIGLVESTDYQSARRQPIFEAIISDDTGVCRIIWFHGGFLRDQLRPGQVIMASGKVALYKHQLQMTNPKFLVINEKSSKTAEYFSGGVYPASSQLSSMQIKKIIGSVREAANKLVPEFYDKNFL